MVVLTITVIGVCGRSWKDHPGTNCPFHTVHTRRLLFGLGKNALFAKSMIVYCSTRTLSSEVSLLQNEPSWRLPSPSPFLSVEPFMVPGSMAHLMRPSSVTSSGFVSGLELGLDITWGVHLPLSLWTKLWVSENPLFPVMRAPYIRKVFLFVPKTTAYFDIEKKKKQQS